MWWPEIFSPEYTAERRLLIEAAAPAPIHPEVMYEILYGKDDYRLVAAALGGVSSYTLPKAA